MTRGRAAAAGLSALALLAGLVWLGTIFAAERAGAFAAQHSRRVTLTQFVRQALARELEAAWRAAGPATQAAEGDPLLPAEDLLLVVGGEQRLPRRWQHRPGDGTPALDRLKLLRPDGPELATDDPVWGQRLALRAAFFTALAAGDAEAQARTFRALLTHRLRFVVPADHDLPAFIALLQAFTAQGRPDRATLRGVLRDGLDDGQGDRLRGVQRDLLRRRDRFTQADFAGLSDAVSALSVAAGVEVDDFEARAAEAPAPPVTPLGPIDGPSSVGGRWVVDRDGPDAVRGVAVDRAGWADGLTERMRAGGLLGPREGVDLDAAEPAPGPVPLGRVPFRLRLPDATAAERAADRAFRLKIALLAVTAALVLALLALALTAHRRRQRLLDLKDGFIRTVSHELRTPLASIRAMAETLERRLAGEPKARDYPTRIVRDVDGLGHLVENILSFNRLDHGRWVLKPEPVALAEVLAWAQDEVTRHAPRPVEWSVTGPAVTLDADATLLQLVCLNLARNACHYSDRTPIRLAWAVARQGSGVTVSLTDNGRGIAPEALPHVFTAFYRAAQPTSARGSGLGLALCQQVMALHGGRIEVAQTSAEGTTVALHFPAAAVRG